VTSDILQLPGDGGQATRTAGTLAYTKVTSMMCGVQMADVSAEFLESVD